MMNAPPGYRLLSDAQIQSFYQECLAQAKSSYTQLLAKRDASIEKLVHEKKVLVSYVDLHIIVFLHVAMCTYLDKNDICDNCVLYK